MIITTELFYAHISIIYLIKCLFKIKKINYTLFSFHVGVFVIIAICCFGLFWPTDFEHEYNGVTATLSWAYVFAVCSAFLLLAAGLLGILELKSIIMRLAAKQYPAMKQRRKKQMERIEEREEGVHLQSEDVNMEVLQTPDIEDISETQSVRM